MNDLSFFLKLSLHAHEAGVQQDVALILGNFLPDHQVAAAGLVLERYECNAARSTRPLFGDD